MTKGNEGPSDRSRVGSEKDMDGAHTQKHKDARALSARLLEDRRREALQLRAEGLTRASIGRIVGAHADTVGRWLKMDSKKLSVTPRGRKPGQGLLLTQAQEQQIAGLVLGNTPDQLALPCQLWTRHTVQSLIGETLGITPALRTVGNYLSRWGAAPDKPQLRAGQQQDSRTRTWLHDTYPGIKSRAKRENAEIYWLGHHRLPRHPVGSPAAAADPPQQAPSILFAITNKGKTRFRFSADAVDEVALNDLVRRLALDTGRQMILVMDSQAAPAVPFPAPWLHAHRQVIDVVHVPSHGKFAASVTGHHPGGPATPVAGTPADGSPDDPGPPA